MARLRDVRPPAAANSCLEADSQLLFEAHRRLRTADYVELHAIECCVDDGVLTLRGKVSQYYLKQLAFHVVARAAGGRPVSNEIDVPCHNGRRHSNRPNADDGIGVLVPADGTLP